MTPSPYQQPGASIAFWTAFAVFALGEYVMRFRSWRNRGGTRTERWSLVVVVLSVVFGLLAAFAFADRRVGRIAAGQWPLFTIGVALMLFSVVIRQWAIASLGRFFTVDVRVHPDQPVVDSGPYRWVRHPTGASLRRADG